MHGFIVTIKKIDFSVELSIKKSEAYFLDKHTNRSNQNTISDNFGFLPIRLSWLLAKIRIIIS